ncbi:hypothetical protein J6590_039572 [Homalodisca vitripennis]|nr:hypothetical protein J6590_039572 [Homalodisca vitripennis]
MSWPGTAPADKRVELLVLTISVDCIPETEQFSSSVPAPKLNVIWVYTLRGYLLLTEIEEENNNLKDRLVEWSQQLGKQVMQHHSEQ